MQTAIQNLAKCALAADDPEDLAHLVLKNDVSELDGDPAGCSDVNVSLLASGGYNDVWLARKEDLGPHTDNETVKSPKKNVFFVLVHAVVSLSLRFLRTLRLFPRKDIARDGTPEAKLKSIIIRIPNQDSLRPHQIRNEVGWLRYLTVNHPDTPVPRVWAYSDGSSDDSLPFIIEEYIDGQSLSEIWNDYSENEKEVVARQVAALVVRLGEIRFDRIGGMTPSGELGPTVEGIKLFRGRDKFHDTQCYDIGPYTSARDYLLAMYDKEIHYYTNADSECFDEDLFADVSREAFVEELKRRKTKAREQLVNSAINTEPLVLCHNDLHGRNILMQGTKIVGVIDWEFAGSFPLSELVDGGIEVLEMQDETSEEECFEWCERIEELIKDLAVKWTEKDIESLTGAGDPIFQAARVEMFPE